MHLWITWSRLKGHFVELNRFSTVSWSVNRGAERVRKGRSWWAGTVWMAAEAAGVSGGGLESAHFLSLGWSAWYSSGVGGGQTVGPRLLSPSIGLSSMGAWDVHGNSRQLRVQRQHPRTSEQP